MLSTLAAAGFFTFVLFLGADAAWLRDDVEVVAASVTFVGFMWFTIAQLAFVPALIAFLILESGRIGSLLANLVAGGFCALVAMVLVPMSGPTSGETGPLPYDTQEIWIAALASGFIGGFAHWILAGFRAGRWMGPPRTEQAPV